MLQVRINDEAREAYLALRPNSSWPEGTLLAAFHKDTRSGKAGPVYVMERENAGWRYSAFDADGRAAEHGVLTLCERCHSESPNGGPFGLPR